VYGGKYDKENLFIEPTILENVNVNSTIMTEEIFGPVLPVFTFNTKAEAVELINKNPNPLSFYVFTSSIKKEEDWLQIIPFGGGCVNNTVYHFANDNLHFGGIGNSGIGSYHGKQSFYTFTHAKPVMKTPTWLDPAIKYPTFKNKLKWIKLLLR
jgi:aldehyde dehydrogenase (NAD+)